MLISDTNYSSNTCTGTRAEGVRSVVAGDPGQGMALVNGRIGAGARTERSETGRGASGTS